MRMTGLMLICALVTTGCGLELLGTTAIRGGLEKENMQQMKRTLEHAEDTTAALSANQAIGAYYAEQGVYPPSLQALVPEWLPSVPIHADGTPYGYDPATGSLLDSAAPVAATPIYAVSDSSKLTKIETAVQEYVQETGSFPTSLWALVPDYLPDYIAANSGADFIYDAQTGTVTAPAPVQVATPAPGAPGAPRPPRQKPRRVPVGGGGPMGEVMTGISIQNELGNMSNAGSSAVRSRARGMAKDAAKQQQRQAGNTGQ